MQGDFLAEDKVLPRVNPGDWLIIHDTRAYTKAMFGKFHSTRSGLVYALTKSTLHGERFVLKCIKSPESLETVIKLWETPEVCNSNQEMTFVSRFVKDKKPSDA